MQIVNWSGDYVRPNICWLYRCMRKKNLKEMNSNVGLSDSGENIGALDQDIVLAVSHICP